MRKFAATLVMGSALLVGACAGKGQRAAGVEQEMPRVTAEQRARAEATIRAYGSVRSIRLLLFAERNLRQQNYGNAIAASTAALGMGELTDRGRSIALAIRATGYGLTGRIDLARKDIAAALLADPHNVMALNTRAGELMTARRHAEAEAIYNRSIAIRPTPRAHFGRAIARALRRQYAAALADVNATIALAPRFSPAYSLRGVIEYGLGRREAARRDFQQALRLNSRDPVAGEALRAMDAGRYSARPSYRRQAPVGREGSI